MEASGWDDLTLRRQVMQDKHRIQVAKSLTDSSVFLVVDGEKYELSPSLARDLGEALYKTGADQTDRAGQAA